MITLLPTVAVTTKNNSQHDLSDTRHVSWRFFLDITKDLRGYPSVSIFAAKMKSFSERPRTVWVERVMVT